MLLWSVCTLAHVHVMWNDIDPCSVKFTWSFLRWRKKPFYWSSSSWLKLGIMSVSGCWHALPQAGYIRGDRQRKLYLLSYTFWNVRYRNNLNSLWTNYFHQSNLCFLLISMIINKYSLPIRSNYTLIVTYIILVNITIWKWNVNFVTICEIKSSWKWMSLWTCRDDFSRNRSLICP